MCMCKIQRESGQKEGGEAEEEKQWKRKSSSYTIFVFEVIYNQPPIVNDDDDEYTRGEMGVKTCGVWGDVCGDVAGCCGGNIKSNMTYTTATRNNSANLLSEDGS